MNYFAFLLASVQIASDSKEIPDFGSARTELTSQRAMANFLLTANAPTLNSVIHTGSTKDALSLVYTKAILPSWMERRTDRSRQIPKAASIQILTAFGSRLETDLPFDWSNCIKKAEVTPYGIRFPFASQAEKRRQKNAFPRVRWAISPLDGNRVIASTSGQGGSSGTNVSVLLSKEVSQSLVDNLVNAPLANGSLVAVATPDELVVVEEFGERFVVISGVSALTGIQTWSETITLSADCRPELIQLSITKEMYLVFICCEDGCEIWGIGRDQRHVQALFQSSMCLP